MYKESEVKKREQPKSMQYNFFHSMHTCRKQKSEEIEKYVPRTRVNAYQIILNASKKRR